MNDHTQRMMADSGLDLLKEAVLLVLYEQHRNERVYATLGFIKEHLGLPRGRSGQNHLVRGVLEILEVRGYAERNYSFDGAWQITENGILYIES